MDATQLARKIFADMVDGLFVGMGTLSDQQEPNVMGYAVRALEIAKVFEETARDERWKSLGAERAPTPEEMANILNGKNWDGSTTRS